MRNNNTTGGAVGNVSDREVAMFISAAAALQDTSSPDALYSQMLDLHKTGEEMVTKQAEKYKKAFGDEYYSIWGLESSLNDVNVGFVFPTTFKEALQKQRTEKMNMDIGLGENLPANPQQIPQINSVEEAFKLPKGTIFKDANGITRRR